MGAYWRLEVFKWLAGSVSAWMGIGLFCFSGTPPCLYLPPGFLRYDETLLTVYSIMVVPRVALPIRLCDVH
ncbi:hypothetical protein B0H66DRAFT_293325 [Apodospora peruviana]|uniref:Uncharacterized protein n=1 Tax=Apodospora peruviana TaxID=516989 RepID=A0AAE0M266_9PEZI|nr:hypothetical protein B0H66DRAFT_293325 [Apodospora peruviana]